MLDEREQKMVGVDEKYRSERWLSASNHVVRKSECFVIVFKKEY